MARSAASTAVSFIWLLVASGTAPLAQAPPGTAQARPPGPGLPIQDPSVYTVVAAPLVIVRRALIELVFVCMRDAPFPDG